MMGYYGSGGGMMGSAGYFGVITWIVVIADLILAGIWLYQHISKK